MQCEERRYKVAWFAANETFHYANISASRYAIHTFGFQVNYLRRIIKRTIHQTDVDKEIGNDRSIYVSPF